MQSLLLTSAVEQRADLKNDFDRQEQ